MTRFGQPTPLLPRPVPPPLPRRQHYEGLKSPDRSCTLAKQAFDEAVQPAAGGGGAAAGGAGRDEAPGRESALIMQLLRDNLTLWTSEAHVSKQDLA